jgi:outer membrane lipoprotein-sorting protein
MTRQGHNNYTGTELFSGSDYFWNKLICTNPKLNIMTKKLFTMLLLSAMTLTMAWSQSVDDILNKYFQSIGGVDKWKALKSVKMTGTMPTPQGDFAFELCRKAPNKYLISLDIMGKKMIPQAFDGEIGWTLNPFMGSDAPQKLPAEQVSGLKDEAEFEDPFINYKSKGYQIVLEADGDVDGVKCFVLHMTRSASEGNTAIDRKYYLDKETYLQLMTSEKGEDGGQMAGQEVNTYFSDYQDVGDGIMIPFTMETRFGGQSMKIKFTAVKVNEDISDDVFKYTGN